jgi:D-glycero-D-manno-heptose 1,7-bisphosphate phosphatase
VTAQEVDALHIQMRRTIVEAGGRIDAVYLCPHIPDAGCDCRKPMPGLLVSAASDLGLNLDRCLLVGDSITDLGAAQAAGCPAILVRSGLSGHLLDNIDDASLAPPMAVVPDLGAAVELLIDQLESSGAPEPSQHVAPMRTLTSVASA